MSILIKLGKESTRSPKEQELYDKLVESALKNLEARNFEAVGHLCGAISKLK